MGLLRKAFSDRSGSKTFLAETYLRRLPPLCGRICRARLTKRSAPGIWPGATVGSVSLNGNPESLRRELAIGKLRGEK